MNRDAVADPIDRLPDERLAVGIRAVRAARFHGHVIAETDAAHRPSQIESRPMRVGQPDEERIGVPRLIPGGDEHSLCADRCRCGGAPFPSCRRARADGPCRRGRRRDALCVGAKFGSPWNCGSAGIVRAGRRGRMQHLWLGRSGLHGVGKPRGEHGIEGGSSGTPTIASTADSPPDSVPPTDRDVGGAGALPGPQIWPKGRLQPPATRRRGRGGIRQCGRLGGAIATASSGRAGTLSIAWQHPARLTPRAGS